MRKKLDGFCVEVTRASFYLGLVVFALVPLRWLFLTGYKVVQVIAVLLVLGLVVAWVYGFVLVVRQGWKPKVEYRCDHCVNCADCPAAHTGPIYPCPYFLDISKFCKTKPVDGGADQVSAEDQDVLQKEPRP